MNDVSEQTEQNRTEQTSSCYGYVFSSPCSFIHGAS